DLSTEFSIPDNDNIASSIISPASRRLPLASFELTPILDNVFDTLEPSSPTSRNLRISLSPASEKVSWSTPACVATCLYSCNLSVVVPATSARSRSLLDVSEVLFANASDAPATAVIDPVSPMDSFLPNPVSLSPTFC